MMDEAIMTRIVLADDQKSVRLGLRLLLEQEYSITVIGDAYNAGSLLTHVASNCPDLVLLDWGLPGMQPDQLINTLRTLCPKIQIIILSGRPGVMQAAINSGADSFVSKGVSPENLIRTIQSIS